MNSPETLKKAVDLLVQGTPEILDIEAMGEQASERDSARLRAWARIARAVAVQKNLAVAGSDKVSDIVRKLTFPLAVTDLLKTAIPKTAPSPEALKSNANVWQALPTAEELKRLRELAARAGLAFSTSDSSAVLYQRLKWYLIAAGLKVSQQRP